MGNNNCHSSVVACTKHFIDSLDAPAALLSSENAILHRNRAFTPILEALVKDKLATIGNKPQQFKIQNFGWQLVDLNDSHDNLKLLSAVKLSRESFNIDHPLVTNTIIDNVPAQIFWKDKNLIYLGCNDAFVQSLNLLSKDEVIGKSDYDLPVNIEDSKKFRADDRSIITSRQPKLHIEEKQVLADGTERHLLTNKVPLLDKNMEVQGILAVYVDITPQKKLSDALQRAKEKAEASNDTLKNCVAGIYDDLRLPFAHMLRHSETGQKSASAKEEMLQLSPEQMLAFVHSLLDFVSSSSFDEKTAEESPFDPQELLSHIFNIEEPLAKLKNLDLTLKYDDRIPKVIHADKSKVYRVLLNLLSHAITYTNQTSITVEARQKSCTEHTIDIEFIVSDMGIESDDMKYGLQSLLNHTPPSTTNAEDEHELQRVKGYINVLGGSIQLSTPNEDGQETRCVFTLPVKRVHSRTT